LAKELFLDPDGDTGENTISLKDELLPWLLVVD
jgi:hypothetical protein